MSSSSNKSIGILVEAYKELKTIAIALGPDRSVNGILPFLTCERTAGIKR